MDKKIDEEIRNHKKWCSKKCDEFLPEAYRSARLQGLSAKMVQKNDDLCHIFR